MHTLTLKLKCSSSQKKFIAKTFHISYLIYVLTVKEIQKRLRLLSRNKRYKYLKHLYGLNINDKKKLKIIKDELNKIISSYQISGYDIEKFVSILQKKYKNYITSHQAQKIALFVSTGVKSNLFGNGKKLRIKKFTEFNTISQKNDLNGIKFFDTYIKFFNLTIPVIYSKNKKDLEYIKESLDNKLKYCELLKIEFNSGDDYYIKLVLEGDAPVKYTKGKGISGIDPGVSSVAFVSDTCCILEELAPKSKEYNKEIAKLQKQIDKSTRSTNPDKFNPDGTIKKENKSKFFYTKHCKYLKRKVRVLYRKKSAYTKCMHRNLANRIIQNTDSIKIEDMNFKALAKKAKKTERQEKTTQLKTKDGVKTINKYKRKKRFGKSITDRSSALFVKILEEKSKSQDIDFNKINTKKVKASQYNHKTDSYEKHKLSERTKYIGKDYVQRDLYSGFVIKNVSNDLETIDKESMKKNFKKFLKLEKTELERLKETNIKNKNFYSSDKELEELIA